MDGNARAGQTHDVVHVGLEPARARRLAHDADHAAARRAAESTGTVAVERADANGCTYWITVKNLTAHRGHFEGRYAVLN